MALQQMCLDIDESLKVIATRPQRGTLIVSVSKPGLHCFLPHRSLCPHSPSRPPKPDYCLSIHTQSLLLIRTNLLVTEHTSSLLRPATTGAALPQTIINLKCLPLSVFSQPLPPLCGGSRDPVQKHWAAKWPQPTVRNDPALNIKNPSGCKSTSQYMANTIIFIWCYCHPWPPINSAVL